MKIIQTIALCFISLMVSAQQSHNVITPREPLAIPLPQQERGTILSGVIENSEIYPGTKRTFQVLIPKGYDGKTPACLILGLDGNIFGAVTIIDNMVKNGDIPMTIGVFLNPGTVNDKNDQVIRYNRSNEFDRTDGRFAEFLEKEVLPAVERMKTPSGQPILISSSPNDRAITGASSSGIAAFTVAWERPDLFARVYSSVGTFVAMRGGNEYPAIVRKTEPKKLRIYLQDGVNDTWNHIFGDWWEYNQLMSSALNFAGYEFDYKWDRGGHSIYYGTRTYPEAMRWLWKGWPAEIQTGESMNGTLKSLLIKDEDWKKVGETSHPSTLFSCGEGTVAVRVKNEIKVADATGTQIFSRGIPSSHKVLDFGKGEDASYYMITTDGHAVYVNGKKTASVKNAHSALKLLDGRIYISSGDGSMWLTDEKGRRPVKLSTTEYGDKEFALFPHQKLLVTTEKNSDWLLSYAVDEDGMLKYGQQYYWLHNVDNHAHTPYGNICFDTLGYLYIATPIGIQVCDHNGRVRAILPMPDGGRKAEAVVVSGHFIYVVSGGSLYVRKVNHVGYDHWSKPVDVKSQGAG